MKKSSTKSRIKVITLLAVVVLTLGMMITVSSAETGYTFVGWGSNSHGQLNIPISLSDYKKISCGFKFSVGLKVDGTVSAWGYDELGQCEVPNGLKDVIAVSAGTYHTLALKSDGTVVAWGYYVPRAIDIPPVLSDITNPNFSKVIAISAGDSHSMALRENGTVIAWGGGSRGMQVLAPDGLEGVSAISAGRFHSLALKSDGTVVSWGTPGLGEDHVSELSGIIAVSAGDSHSLFLKNDGTVVERGYNNYGEWSVPEGLSNVIGIDDGSGYSVALKSDGTVVAWGNNSENQCDVPLGLANVTEISAGADHVIAKVDTAPPTLTVPSNMTVEATSASGANVSFSATATDSVDTNVAISYSQDPGTIFPIGTTHVMVTATDDAGNTATYTFDVTVVDTIAPALTVPSNIVAEATSANGANVTFSAIATDLVDTSVAITYSKASGTTFPLRPTTVTVTATDIAGNKATRTFTVTVRDTTPPEIILNGSNSITVIVCGTYTDPGATATDKVSRVVTVSKSSNVVTTAVGTYKVTYTATDKAGNKATAERTVKVIYKYVGILDPINANNTSLYKLGSIIPVAFSITNSTGSSISNAVANFSFVKISSTPSGTVLETKVASTATAGTLFKYNARPKKYVYNWSTKGLTIGTYQLSIKLNDGMTYNVNVSLKL